MGIFDNWKTTPKEDTLTRDEVKLLREEDKELVQSLYREAESKQRDHELALKKAEVEADRKALEVREQGFETEKAQAVQVAAANERALTAQAQGEAKAAQATVEAQKASMERMDDLLKFIAGKIPTLDVSKLGFNIDVTQTIPRVINGLSDKAPDKE